MRIRRAMGAGVALATSGALALSTAGVAGASTEGSLDIFGSLGSVGSADRTATVAIEPGDNDDELRFTMTQHSKVISSPDEDGVLCLAMLSYGEDYVAGQMPSIDDALGELLMTNNLQDDDLEMSKSMGFGGGLDDGDYALVAGCAGGLSPEWASAPEYEDLEFSDAAFFEIENQNPVVVSSPLDFLKDFFKW